MRLLGSTTKDDDKNENGENVQKLESVEVVLFTVISSKMIINILQKFYLLLFQTSNLVS